ncbi:alkene reductase [Rhodococcus aetherivorans]|uniref:NADPH dehydrogenase n=2 Tax=Rhodococcus TaxID=1827 RepID=A0ABQ0YMP7_9NOCA|nr:alkene reductase [Rhodococcus aetherivorans]ETT24686.1 12-oxophytodienoate reductase [Rhodococcus rhodochrous ATCC 21198]AKE88669.1 1,2-oxophytodienoate reductase [Rhodococcus aetherivorans]KDE14827.1 1,2-oxophytodienoate reductase [Rhodococcus aetherivorans]MBC2591682.1 alkene reductase [Rhodococcus aetherivorans]NGP25053.1 alkene reductase [Rhodococcus aetherivorans]
MDLFTPVTLGDLELANRVVMAPLTRLRSGASGVPGDLVVEHYRQRASAGLIIAEGTYVNHESQAFVGQPGIVTGEQVAGWRRVAEAVHDRGGRIVLQVMHGGRVTHPDVNGGRRVVAPSAIAIDGVGHTEKGKQPYPVPHALTTEEARAIIGDFVAAARRAIEAGLDGVEIHSANGYLLHEFLSPAANQRADEYGGSPQNRARFVVEVVTAVASAIGAGRVGLRISPEHNIQDAYETDRDDVLATYGALLEQVRPLNLAYLSVLHADPAGELVQELRRRFGGRLIANSGFASPTTRAEAVQLIEAAHADAVAVGRALIANPDLVERWHGEHPENELRPALFYSPGAEGYTDYPFLQAG